MKSCWLAISFALLLLIGNLVAKVFWLSSLFGKRDVAGRIAFYVAVDQYSTNSVTFKSRMLSMENDEDVVELVDKGKSCGLLLTKSIAIFTALDTRSSENVRLLCESHEIPLVMAKFDDSSKPFLNSIDLYPPYTAVGTWQRAVILYQDSFGEQHFRTTSSTQNFIINYYLCGVVINSFFSKTSLLNLKNVCIFFGLTQLQELLNLQRKDYSVIFHAQRLNPGRQFRPQLKQLKELQHIYFFVVQADLVTAMEMNMLGPYYHYVFTDLDVYTLDLVPYKMKGCNITAIRFVDDDAPVTKRIIARLKNHKSTNGSLFTFTSGTLPTYVAVINDAVSVIAKTAIVLQNSLKPESVDCRNGSVWRGGTTFMNFLKSTAFQGSTGHIQFDGYGKRFNFSMQIVEATTQGFVKIAAWTQQRGLEHVKSDLPKTAQIAESLENKVLRVTVYMEAPFVMYKKSVEKLSGNDRYEGFCIDLLERIAEMNKFNFTIHEVKDKSYGTPDANGRWNGIIVALNSTFKCFLVIKGNHSNLSYVVDVGFDADVAVASLTINFVRSEVIDFSVPYMHLGISILFKKPEKTPPSLLSFLAPLSLDVWMYMGAAYVVVSLILWLVARISPSEWVCSHTCQGEEENKENQFSLGNSFWFTIGSLMQQGCDIAPRAVGTRMVASVWWFFTLILISSYTANLAAFLTVERMEYTINSAEDLVKQTKIRYGTLNRGSTMQFFKDSKIPVYEKMWMAMKSSEPSVFVNGSREGINRVKQGNYAYLMESSMLEFYVERDCDLTQIGGLLDSKGYGIGFRKGSPYREAISQTILYLQEKTVITELKDKWWKRRGGGKCDSADGKSSISAELGLQNVGGVFVVMLLGLGLAVGVTIFEKLKTYTQSRQQKRDE
ncbi:Glutamate receptor ionotropic, kainate 2 [Trichinella pseudospiralis]|uniref:Glutamate receptor 1 n=1 Tax=Trichinella pseudospiralis TaxID=6337 RepID=A0A0V1HK74_TRIPS|nr:Glutamate receptor ionotropic, kainate 2 [Trichinella pseudospiralis]